MLQLRYGLFQYSDASRKIEKGVLMPLLSGHALFQYSDASRKIEKAVFPDAPSSHIEFQYAAASRKIEKPNARDDRIILFCFSTLMRVER